MKSLITCMVVLLLASSALAQNRTLNSLLGVWECIDQRNDRGALEFIDSSKVMISFMGEKREVSDFKVDFSKMPYWFAFTIKEPDTQFTVKSFLYFVDDNNIKWEVFLPAEPGQAADVEFVMLRRKANATALK